ncbi:phosphoribosyltransferase [Microbacterium arborescens]|uniref:phosphoribosyltransferase n=1 Tax=Microbacterium arborescens TaxID=33883 RepID=UPI0013B3EB2E|nr:phosphoribosyltransferase [Microbacterium arborescens]
MLDAARLDVYLEARQQSLIELGARIQNPVRIEGVTCLRCTGAENGTCYRCDDWISRGDEADRVIPLAYGVYNTQFRSELRAYKNESFPRGQQPALRTLRALMWSFSYYHAGCLIAVSSEAPTVVTTVPSGRARQGMHPFEKVAQFAPAEWDRVDALRRYDIEERACDPESVTFRNSEVLDGQHVVVLDDAWATGSKAEGVAMAARREGATEVTIITIGRIVNTSYSPAQPLLQLVGGTTWDWRQCPVTGSVCPDS